MTIRFVAGSRKPTRSSGSIRPRRNIKPRRRRLLAETLEKRVVLSATIGTNLSVGDQLQNYRLAVAATAEYTAYFGGQTQALSAIQTFVGELNEIFEDELSIHFDLVSNTNTIFTDSGTDGYTNGNTSQMLGANTGILDGILGNGAYDIGHVFGTATSGGAGLATLGSVGNSSLKGQGASISSYPQGESWLKLVAHEIGHQFHAEHTFNADAFGSAIGNRSAGDAYEPASGTTLMSYAGISGADNLQASPDPYFHSASFDAIQSFISASAPPHSTTATLNNIPSVTGGSDHTIPAGTPFTLTAAGSDADSGDTLTYTWEQLDLGPAMSLPITDNGSSPLFRSFPPTTDPTRVFPNLPDLASGANTAAMGETLPTTTRPLNFRTTVRDGSGGVHSDDVLLSVVDTGANFAVTSPNSAVTWTGGGSQTITWDVAGTTANGINTNNVAISLSVDGGLTYPFTLAASTANDGTESVVLPNVDASEARVRVSAVGNVFFDLSDVNFSIQSNPAAAGISIVESDGSTLVGEPGVVGGSTVDTYSVALNTIPSGTVEVTIAGDSQTEVSLDGSNFGTSVVVSRNDTSPATIYVRGIDDTDFEGVHSGSISHVVTASSDPNYTIGPIHSPLFVSIADDEIQPVVGVDFDTAGGASPSNWTKVNSAGTITDLTREDSQPTTIDLSFSHSGSFGANASTISPVPQHSPSLSNIDGNFIASNSLTLTWQGLIAGNDYNLYLLAGENFSSDLFQSVSITGATTLPTFEQDTRTLGNELLVNSAVAASDKTLSTDAVVATADASGEIQIVVTNIQGSGHAILAGAAIQPLPAAAPTISADLSVTTIGNEQGPIDIVYTVTLSEVNNTGSSVTFDIDDLGTGTASPGLDYMAISTSAVVSVPHGQSSGTFTVSVIDDALIESNETVDVQISNPSDSGFSIGNGQASALILDDEPAAMLSVEFGATTISESSGPSATTVTITRNTDTSAPLNLTLKSFDTSEITLPTSATIPAGQSSVTVNLDAIDESYLDGTQTVSISAITDSYQGAILPDLTFDSDGSVTTGLAHPVNPTGYDLKLQDDGKILAFGVDSTISRTWQIVRLNTDGSYDNTFGTSGIAATTFPGSGSIRAEDILLHADGRITVVGRGLSGTVVARYTALGMLDTTFSGDGWMELSGLFLRAGVAHSDGSITIAGAKSGGSPSNALVRILNDGSFDSNFGSAGTVTNDFTPSDDVRFEDILVQSDGKMIVAGTASVSGSNTHAIVARYNHDGSLDSAYGSGGFQLVDPNDVFLDINAIELTPDGGTVVVGHAGDRSDWLLFKFDSSGSLDANFDDDGIASFDFHGASDDALDVVVQDDGKIIVLGGGFVIGNGDDRGIARFNSNGSLDTTFSDDGFETFPPFVPTEFEGIVAGELTADGKLVTFSGWVNDFRIERWTLPSGLAGSNSLKVTDDDVVGVGYLVGVDFDFGGASPSNWTPYEFLFQANGGNLLAEDGVRSTFDIDSNSQGTSSVTPISANSATIPQHTQPLTEIGGYAFNKSGNDFTSTISDLTPGEEYRVYLFAHEFDSGTFTQDISFSGANTVAFTQTLSQGDLHVNRTVGSSSADLESYAELVTADANGEILITVAPAAGSAGIAVSGFAIQRFVGHNNRLDLTIDVGSIDENGGSATATLTRNTGTAGDLVVDLVSSDTSEAIVPMTITIPDGSSSATFPVTAVDESDFDGDQTATITASASNFHSDAVSIIVVDDEVASEGPLVGIDFGSGSTSPTNWSQSVFLHNADFSDMIAEDGSSTPYDVQTDADSGFANGSTINASTIPIHTQSLQNLDGYAVALGASSAMTATYSDLAPGAEYRVYVFGYEAITSSNYVNEVTITGSNSVSFTQTLQDGVLMVNGATGSASNDLRTYEQRITASSSGQIIVQIETPVGADGISLAGLAIQQIGDAPDALSVSVNPTSISENGGTATGTVTRSGNTTNALVVNLTSDDTSEAIVPASVTIPAGSTSTTFSVTGVDDSVLDDTQSVTLSASATNYFAGSTIIDVTDDDVSQLGPLIGIDFDSGSVSPADWTRFTSIFSANATDLVAEGGTITNVDFVSSIGSSAFGGPSTTPSSGLPTHTQSLAGIDGVVGNQNNTPFTATYSDLVPGAPYGIYLFVNEFFGLSFDQEVTYSGANSVNFIQTVPNGAVMINDGIGSNANSLQSYAKVVNADSSGVIDVTITQRPGSDGIAFNAIAIQQFGAAPPALALSFDTSTMSENGGSITATVSRTGDTSSPLTVNLSSNDTTEATVPGSVVIPAGNASTTFPITAVDDAILDGTQNVDISVSASGFTSVIETISVQDDEAPSTGPLVGADFDVPTGVSPFNWSTLSATSTPVTAFDLRAEDGSFSPYDLSVISAAGQIWSSTASVNPSTIPSHTQSLANLDGQIYTSANSVEFIWHDLTPGSNYEVYVFGLEGFVQPIIQSVLITGAGPSTSFTQSFGLSQLYINDSLGQSGASLSDYAIISEASPTGEISIQISPGAGTADVSLGGLAIREIISQPFNATFSVDTNGHESGPVDIVYTVTLDRPNDTGSPISFDIGHVLNSTATAGQDHQFFQVNDQITVAAGATSGSFVLPVFDDATPEPTETVIARISNPSHPNVILSPSTDTATATIIDNDTPPTLTVDIVESSISEAAGANASVVTVTRTGELTAPLDVTLNSNDLTEATVPQSVTIPAGQSSVSFNLDAVDDTAADGTQTVTVSAAATSGIAFGTIGLDPSFGTGGIANTQLQTSYFGNEQNLAVQADGRIVAASRASNPSFILVSRFNSDGSPDTSFNGGNAVPINIGSTQAEAQSVKVDDQGNLLIGGKTNDGGFAPFLIRLLSDGTLDSSFGSSGFADLSAFGPIGIIDFQFTPQGDIVAAAEGNWPARLTTVKIRSNGTPDLSFGINGIQHYRDLPIGVPDLEMLSDGRFIVAGTGSSAGAIVVRMMPDGSLDPSFGDGGRTWITHTNRIGNTPALAISSEGKIAVGGAIDNGSSAWDFMVSMLTSDGQIDTSFGTNGIVSVDLGTNESDYISHLMFQDDGKIIAVGETISFTSPDDVKLIRLLPNGVLDNSFDSDGRLTFSTGASGENEARGSVLDANGNLLILAGTSTSTRIGRFTTGLLHVEASDTVAVTNNDQSATLDFGDAPSAAQSGFASSYPVTLADNGARHTVGGPSFGLAQSELDGIPSEGAISDDLNGIDDEDGVFFAGEILASRFAQASGTVEVTLSNASVSSNRLDAWIDFNRDGDWDDAGEQIFDDFDLGTANGTQQLNFNVPQDLGSNIQNGDSYARFRISTAGNLSPTGAASDGEVEDHRVRIVTADSFIVDTLDDEQDGDYSASNLSLREAIHLANRRVGADSIEFSPGLFGGTIELALGQLQIQDDLSILGPVGSSVTISGMDRGRVFDIFDQPSVTLDHLIVRNGLTQNFGDQGGGIRSDGTLTIRSSQIVDNATQGVVADGGGISHSGGALIVDDTTVANNRVLGVQSIAAGIRVTDGDFVSFGSVIDSNVNLSSSGFGGGVFVTGGDATVEQTSITNNTSLTSNAIGGGLAVASGSLDLSDSTVSGNQSDSYGAGILFGSTSHTATITNSTISGNTSVSSYGGGIAIYQGTANIIASTVTLNSAPAGMGSGIASHSDTGIVSNTTITSSIVSGNVNSDVDNIINGNGTASIASGGFNLIGTGNSLPAFIASDQTNITSPGLSPLGNNGGLTKTHALMPSSPALDQGPSSSSLAFDQRGAGFPRLMGSAVDVGAFELDITSSLSIVAADATKPEGNSGFTAYTFTVERSGFLGGTASVAYAVTGSSSAPANADDFGGTLPSGIVSFASGESVKTITVNVSGDTDVESDEGFTVTLSDPVGGASIATSTAPGTIQNDDLTNVDIAVDSNSILEDSMSSFTFTLTRTNVNSETPGLAVGFNLSGSALDGNDYTTSATSVVQFAPGASTATLTITPIADSVVELDETVVVSLQPGAGYTLAAMNSATVEIANDDDASLTITDVAAEEGVGLVFTVTLFNAVQDPFTVTAQFADGTAGPTDYTKTPVNLNFVGTAGESHQFTVATNDDDLVESDETFTVLLDSSNDVVDRSDTAVGTIINNDSAAMPKVESIVYFNQDAEAERELSPDNTGQRSIIRQVQIVFDGAVNVPIGTVVDDSFKIESIGGRRGREQVGLQVTQSDLINGKQIVVLKFIGRDLIEPLSRRGRVDSMLIDGSYRLTIDGAKLGIDANGVSAGTTATDEFFRLFGDYDGNRRVDSIDHAVFMDYLDSGQHSEVFDFDNKTSKYSKDTAEFISRYGSARF